MNKQIKLMIVVLVLVNVAIVGWLLLRSGADNSSTVVNNEAVLEDLLQDNTMEAARYDLADEADRLNVIFISLDALRYDRTGFGGNKAGLTPNLDAFAEEAGGVSRHDHGGTLDPAQPHVGVDRPMALDSPSHQQACTALRGKDG